MNPDNQIILDEIKSIIVHVYDLVDKVDTNMRSVDDLLSQMDFTPDAVEAQAPPPPDEAPAPPPVRTELKNVQTEKGKAEMGSLTIQNYLDRNWRMDQLIAQGFVETIEVPIEEPEAPPPPLEAPPPPPEEPEAPPPSSPAMSPKAKQTTYEQFIDAGWTHEKLLKAGYLADTDCADPAPVEPKEVYGSLTAPARVGNTWVDISGDVWDRSRHSESKDMQKDPSVPPKLNKEGRFVKRRGVADKTAKKEVTPSLFDDAPEPPPDLLADAPPPPVLDGTPDAELESLVSGFNASA